jgi:hypothetical protein
LCAWSLLAAPPALPQDPGSAESTPAVVVRHCGACHLGLDAERDLDFALLFAAPPATGSRGAAQLEHAFAAVRAGTMPPADEPQPDAATRTALALAFAAAWPVPEDAGQPTLRRLSRREYATTVRAVFGVEPPPADLLPEDPRVHGFDNLGDGRALSPLGFEQYAAAAAMVSRAVLANPAARAACFPAGLPLDAAVPPWLARAFRRPPAATEVAARVVLAAAQHEAGGSEDAGLDALLQSVLLAPSFLFRVETGEPDAAARLTGPELAVRLAYLCTAGPPDAELTAAAAAGHLSDPAVRLAHAQRLLATDAGRALAETFFDQWLRARDVLDSNADFRRYPQIWNHSLRPSLREEVLRLAQALVAEDLPIPVLLTADFTHVDGTLAALYGLPAPQGRGLQRVALPDDRRRGVLGMGAFLMGSSLPLRTSPVRRGRYVLEVLLDRPVPPAPPGAGTLPADDTPVGNLSLREQLERHRRDRRCANCHAAMDPFGLLLENFDVLGQWRSELHGQPIDDRAQLADGTEVRGPQGLQQLLRAHQHEFVRSFAKHLLVFATGRPLWPSDEVELQTIVARVHAGADRWSALLGAVLASPLFTHRTSGAPQ